MNTKIAIAVVVIVALIGIVIILSNRPSDITQQFPFNKSGSTTQASKDVVVTVTKDGFSPSTITIKAGTRVIWMNKNAGNVTVNSAVHPTHLVYPKLNLGAFENGSSVQLVFDTVGTYSYHNHFNPSQTGTVIVK